MTNTYKARNIFIEFSVRDGWAREDAAFEFDNFLTIHNLPRLSSSYATVRRIGSSVSLNRAERTKVYMTFENALNHASSV